MQWVAPPTGRDTIIRTAIRDAKLKHGLRVYSLAIPIVALALALALLVWRESRTNVEAFATGLNQPRGMAFDDAGNLYVVEAGVVDPQADDLVSPSTNHSSRLLRIAPNSQVSVIIDGLPFTNYTVAGDIGASDVAVLDGEVYVLTGEGYDDTLSRSVLRIASDGPPQRIVNLLNFAFASTPAAEQLALGGAPSNPFAIVGAPDGQSFYVTDGASGSVLNVKRDGRMRTFAALPNMPPLTGLTIGPDQQLYVAMLSEIPLGRGRGAIWVADPAGRLALAADGLTMPIDVSFDPAGTMYVLEFSDGRQPAHAYAPNSGRLLRIAQDDTRTVVLDRLNYPTAMMFSPEGDLYIAVGGAFSPAGEGAILKVSCAVLDTSELCPKALGKINTRH